MTRRSRLLLFILFFSWPLVLVDTSGPPMVDSVLLATYRLVHHGTFALSDTTDPQIVSQTAAFDISVSQGRVYSGVAPGASLVATPFYAALAPLFAHFSDSSVKSHHVLNYYWKNSRDRGLPPELHLRDCYLLQISLVWLLIAPLFALFGLRYITFLGEVGCSRPQSMVISLAVGFGTMLLFYSSMFDRQVLAYLLSWHAILTLARRSDADQSLRLLGVGSLLGLALSVEYASALLVGLSLLFFLPKRTWRGRACILAPVVASVLGIALYHHSVFGSALSTPYHHRYWTMTEEFARQGLDPSSFEKGLFLGMNLPSLAVMAQLAVGLYKGLFTYSPILLLGLVGLVQGLRGKARRKEYAYCLVVSAAYWIHNSTIGTHLPEQYARTMWGGLSVLWGPRHLLATLPFLAYGLTQLDWGKAGVRHAVLLALGVSITINLLGDMYKQVLMATPAMAKELEVPIAYVATLLYRLGPRVTLLDAYGTPAALQAALLGILLTGSAAISWRVLHARNVSP